MANEILNIYSTGSGKMQGIPSINSDTTENEFCIKMSSSKKDNIICTKCYSMNMLKTFRKNAVPKFRKIGEVLSTTILPTEILPKAPNVINRLHSHGELINTTHLHNFFNIVEREPKKVFTLWTKRRDIVSKVLKDRDKPENLILVYSNPAIDCIMETPPKHFDKVFNNVSFKSNIVNCEGKCIDCLKCYTIGDKTKSIVEVAK